MKNIKKINNIMLVDDDATTNFIHSWVIKQSGYCVNIIVKYNGKDALKYLSDANNVVPDIIFLDINMPIMDCWAFLKEYQNLSETLKSQVLIVMLTNNPTKQNQIKFKEYPEISEFRVKLLSKEVVQEIVEKYFPQLSK